MLFGCHSCQHKHFLPIRICFFNCFHILYLSNSIPVYYGIDTDVQGYSYILQVLILCFFFFGSSISKWQLSCPTNFNIFFFSEMSSVQKKQFSGPEAISKRKRYLKPMGSALPYWTLYNEPKLVIYCSWTYTSS